MSRRPWGDVLAVLLLVALTTAANLDWARRDLGPPLSDANTHSFHVLVQRSRMLEAPDPGRALFEFAFFREHYPPLVYEVTQFAWPLVGLREEALILGLAPFVALLAGSLYGLGLRIGGRPAALACAAVGCTLPVVLDHARMYYLDLPLAATVAFSVLCLVQADGFRHRGWSLAFGLSLALGLLTKWTHPLYVAVFGAVALGRALRAPGRTPAMLLGAVGLLCAGGLWLLFGGVPEPSGALFLPWLALAVFAAWSARRVRTADSPLLNAVEAGLVALLLAGPWYCYNSALVLHKVVYQSGVEVPYRTLLVVNARELGTWVVAGPLLLLAGLAAGLRRQPALTLQLAASLVTGVLLVSFLPADPRYLLPVTAFLVPLSLAWLPVLQGFAWVPAGLVALLGLAQAWSLAPSRALAPRTEPWPFAAFLDALRYAPPEATTWAHVFARPEEAVDLQPRSLLFFSALSGRELFVLETYESPPPEEFPPEAVHNYVLFYRTPQDRQALLQEAQERGVVPAGVEPGATFTFPIGVTSEVLGPPAPASSPSPGPPASRPPRAR